MLPCMPQGRFISAGVEIDCAALPRMPLGNRHQQLWSGTNSPHTHVLHQGMMVLPCIEVAETAPAHMRCTRINCNALHASRKQ